MIISMILILVAILFGIGLFILFIFSQMRKIPSLSFDDTFKYTLKNNKKAIISIGIIKNGEASFKVYGENGQELPPKNHIYEIGSLTKTFTAALIEKAEMDGYLDINKTIDKYLDLKEGIKYPTIKELLTHTSGYRSFYMEYPAVANFFKKRNSFYRITSEMALHKAEKIILKFKKYNFKYSNFGYTILGLIIEKVYNRSYSSVLNEFVSNDLEMTKTKISLQDGDLTNYWIWDKNDAYISAGAITSNISDMLNYAKIQLSNNELFINCHKNIKDINASTKQYKLMDINMDSMGMGWIIDKKNNIIWHNGGTGNYNSYLGFDLEKKTAVVILSNLAPGYRIPATVMGIKLLKEIR